jgi:GNAT superfamily N-acetyltransferase
MPVVTDPDRPDGRLLLDVAGREIGRFNIGRRDGRPLADLFTLTERVPSDDATAAILADLRGWRISASRPLARRLVAAGGRPGRHVHVMSRDLVRNPAPAAWLEPDRIDGYRLTPLDRPAIDLAGACHAAFPPDHPDYPFIRVPDQPEIELEETISGRTMGPLLACSGLAVSADGTVAAAILVNRTKGEPPFGGPWVTLLFRRPDAKGCGVALLRRALALATHEGLRAIGLVVTHGNPAMTLYARHGFTDALEAADVDL